MKEMQRGQEAQRYFTFSSRENSETKPLWARHIGAVQDEAFTIVLSDPFAVVLLGTLKVNPVQHTPPKN